MSKTRPNEPKRGDIWRVEFGPSVGDEIQKTRPAVVVSSDQIGRLRLKLVAAVTGWQESFGDSSWHVQLKPNARNGLSKLSAVDVLQLHAVAMERFGDKMGSLSAQEMEEVVHAIAIVIEFE